VCPFTHLFPTILFLLLLLLLCPEKDKASARWMTNLTSVAVASFRV